MAAFTARERLLTKTLGLWNRLLFVNAAGVFGRPKAPRQSKLNEAASIIGTQSRTVRNANRKLLELATTTHPKPTLHPLELLIVDEADRLKTASLEQLRHLFDRGQFGLVFIGIPGIEKRLARFPQLYSRISGFVHHYRPLPIEELRQILVKRILQLIDSPPSRGLSKPAVLAEILRNSGGNLSLVVRLLTQITRVLEVNEVNRCS